MTIPSITKETFIATKQTHRHVDTHVFVKDILQGNQEYINEYVCMIENILFILEQRFDNYSLPPFFHSHLKKTPPFTPNEKVSRLLQRIIQDTQDRVMYLSQIYMWYLSLLSGGKILKKYMPENKHYLFEYPPETKQLLKNYLDKELESCVPSRKGFILNVDKMYNSIILHFDSYL